MIHKLFTIHDAAAQAYLAPFVLHAEGIAIRTFTDCINDPDHAFGRHPKDYTLMVIAEFDDSTGLIKPYQSQKPLGNGLSFVQNQPTENQLTLLKEAAEK